MLVYVLILSSAPFAGTVRTLFVPDSDKRDVTPIATPYKAIVLYFSVVTLSEDVGRFDVRNGIELALISVAVSVTVCKCRQLSAV